MAISEEERKRGLHHVHAHQPGQLVIVDFRTHEIKGSHKRYADSELVKMFGGDYRISASDLFLKTGDIRDPQELDWLAPNDHLREHPGSDADYLVWMKSPRSTNILAVSVIPSGRKTSGEHEHPGNEKSDADKVIETYQVVKGECDIWIDKKDFRLREGETVSIWPGHWHRAQNPNGHGVLLSIVIGNGFLYSADKLHRRR